MCKVMAWFVAAVAVLAAGTNAPACWRSKAAVRCHPVDAPACYPTPVYPSAATLVIHVPSDAKVYVGGAPLSQTGDTRIDHVPYPAGAIEVCVEVRAEVTKPKDGKKGDKDDEDPDPPGTDSKGDAQVVTKKVCFGPGQTVVVDLRGEFKK